MKGQNIKYQMNNVKETCAQEGKQQLFIDQRKLDVDLVFYGGSAGGGKTFALLFEALRYHKIKNYNAIIFRKNITHINTPGGLYDASYKLFSKFNARCVKHHNTFYFDEFGSKIKLAHLERDDRVYKYDGSEIPLICFDELTHFSKFQFFYLFSRNRSSIGIKPYIRATCNPDPDSWVRDFIDFYIDKNGYAIEERCGLIRYFVNNENEIHWFASKKEAKKDFPNRAAISFTFINSNIEDNKFLLEKDPNYKNRLDSLDKVTRARLLFGNWNIRPSPGDFFNRANFEIVNSLPFINKSVRAWDFAFTRPSETSPDPDYTVGIKVGVSKENVFYVIDIIRFREPPGFVEKSFRNISSQDGHKTIIRIPKDAGGMAIGYVYNLEKALRSDNLRYQIKIESVSKSKEERATLASTHSSNNNIKLLKGKWNQSFLNELELFPIGIHDDQVDALSDAIKELALASGPVRIIDKPPALIEY